MIFCVWFDLFVRLIYIMNVTNAETCQKEFESPDISLYNRPIK